MAEDRRMTAAQVVDKLMGSERVDVVRESVAWLVGELMEAEVVRHEALSDRAGCETSPLGCRSSLEKLGQSEPGTAGEGGSSPDNAGSREHHRIARLGKQDGAVQQA
jgi:hypothetical protein